MALLPTTYGLYERVRGATIEQRGLEPDDGSFEARIVLRRLYLALFLVRRPPQPDKGWAERPLAMLTEMLRFFGTSRDETWRALI